MHLIALGLKEKFDIPWIADFRDPWTDIDFYHKLRLTKWADKKHRRLEKKVLEKADHIVTVSPGCAADLEKIAHRKIEVIYNGFDPTDYQFEKPEPDKTFTISHFGAFNKDRNPASLWIALNQLSEINADFKKLLRIKLIGQTDESIINDIKKNNLTDNLILTDHLPHKEGLIQLSKSQVLLLPLNDAPNVKGILPGKMYEYMALRRPILALGPTDADYAAILRETNAGVPLDFQDLKGIMETLQNYFQLFKENKLEVDSGAYEKFSRKNLAAQFVKLVE
jgi:glycosyltransferase involved in cell wall biosynthesis